MRLSLLFSVILLPFLVFSQTEKEQYIDSLQQVLEDLRYLEKEQQDADILNHKVELLCILAREFDGIDSTKTFDFAHEALKISKQNKYGKGIVDANFTLGRAFMYIDQQKAEYHLEKGYKLANQLIKSDSSIPLLKLWANGTYNLGLTYGTLGKHKKEIEFTDKIIPVVKKLGDSLFLANIYTNLGVKYINLANYNKGYQSIYKGREIYKLLNDPQETTFNVIQLAQAYEGLDSLGQMKKTLAEAKVLLEKHPNVFDSFNYNLQESQYYIRTKKPEDAVKSLDEILGLVENDKNSTLYGIVMQRYSRAYEAMKDFKSATSFTGKYIENSKATDRGMSWFQGLYQRSRQYAAMANYENAYKDLLNAVDIYDSLETIKTVAKLEELNLKYETAQREKEILGLKVKNEEKKSQAYLLGGIASILCLLLFGGYYVYSQRMRKARKKEREREAEVELLKQEQQNKIFSAMIEGQEKERKRLAIDLHDGLGGRLSGISMNLSKLDKDEPKQYPKKQLQKVMKDLNDSLTELRSIARNMMPETLVKFGLQAALKDYCSSMTGSETKVTLQFYGTDKGININQQVTMYRVIQELINNAIKHAKATEVLVQFMREDNQVDITVEDNGVGFDKSKSLKQKDSGMGLSNLQTRVAYLKGNIDFESEENEGTTVNVHINIDAA
ncbi:sensor histidine kinase [Maribacter algarum]|uniref:histidine kinase n=1 Tax=Maribacter algarum (ex Zhang et al. 2020) TaxID=2578118 RepID=A0A5S3PTS9_9FLAO|nr:sensor histidine kinase [Maribacter algarum]TMM58411.1 sensor histidine kinase [Maribacter algarum]